MSTPSQPIEPTQPAPGWYHDPQLAQTLRYWDGAGWTEHRSPAPVPGYPAPGAGYPPVGFAHSVPQQQSMTGGYVLAVLLPVVGLIYGIAKWRVGGAPVVAASIVAWLLWGALLFG